MASIIGAGIAFAVAGKGVNYLFPSEESTSVRDEMNRHNLALEKFTKADQIWQRQIKDKMDSEHYFNNLTKESEIRRSKMDYYINKYVKENPDLPPRPIYEDFYRAELRRNPVSSGVNNLMRSVAAATMGGVATYLAIKYI